MTAVPSEPWRLEKSGLESGNIDLPKSSYLVLAPNASDARRSWPLENFLLTARQVATQHKLAVVVGDKKNHSPIRWPDDTGTNPDLVDPLNELAAYR